MPQGTQKLPVKILVTRKIPQAGLDFLLQHCQRVIVNKLNRSLTKRELRRQMQDNDGLLCLLTDVVDEEILFAADRLKIIANLAVGYDNIAVDVATRRGIFVTNTPGVLADATADLTWALILTVARKIIPADRFVREGEFQGWEPLLFLGSALHGKTLGVIGAGRIGSAVALRSQGFKMNVLYVSNHQNKFIERRLGAKKVMLQKLLRESDFVSIHVPLSESTRYLIAEKQLRMMKPTAYLINTARGEIVDEGVLIRAIREKSIAGAGIDVYEHEPKIPVALRKLDNVVLLPHIGSATSETRNSMALMAAKNLVAGLKGDVPPNLVNPEVLSRK